MVFVFKMVRFVIVVFLISGVWGLTGSFNSTKPNLYKEAFASSAGIEQAENIQDSTRQPFTDSVQTVPRKNAEQALTADSDLPDLVVGTYSFKSWEISEGAPFWISADVKNSGGVSAGPSHVRLYLSTDKDGDISDDYYVGEKPVSALNSGDTETPQWDFIMPDIGSGRYSFWVVFVVDSQKAVAESDERNTFIGTSALNVNCSYGISPMSGTLNPSGGLGSINVTADEGCGWEAESDSNWVSITSNDCGSGDGKVDYSVSSNSNGESRTAAVTISGETFTITQAGGSNCSYSISPESDTYPSSGGSGSVNVTGPEECYWDVVGDSSWITITSDNWGHGEECVSYSVFANYTESSRSGILTIGGKAFTVTQNPGPAEPERYVFDRMWPSIQQPWYFYYPAGIAINGQGNVFVVDSYNNRIQKFTSSGTFITEWGSEGSGDGELNLPKGITTDGQGNVFVVDSWNNRIQKFTSSGTFITKWGSWGIGDGEFSRPDGIAIDGQGNVFVVDELNNRIQKFTSSGTFITKWGSKGSGDGEFYSPRGIATDGQGNVYVADTHNDRIQKFTSSGTFITKWGGSEGSGDGELNNPQGITIDGQGNVYVADSINNRIQKFSSSGTFITKWGGSEGIDDGEFYIPDGIATDGQGNVYVVDSWNDRIQKFSSSGTFITKWGSKGSGDGEFYSPQGIAIDGQGNVYVVDSSNRRIQKFSSSGTFITKSESKGGGDGEFNFPYGIAIDGQGNVYVVDYWDGRIQKFSSSGTFITKWGSKGTGNGEFDDPQGIAIDGQGNVYVADTSNHRIQKFSSSGMFITKWGNKGSGDGEFYSPQGIAIDGQGNVYVADTNNDRIQKFSSSGTFITKWGSDGSGDGEFKYPQGIAIDGQGNVYVADTSNHRIQKFSLDGDFSTKFGKFGSAPGLLNLPCDLAVSATGRIYVLEDTNNRIQIFKEVTTGSNNKAIILAGGGPYSANTLWESTQMCANFAYRTLTYQGFTKESIYYLTSDTDLDLDSNGVADDVDGDATNSNLQQAITEWAKDADSVLLYLTDHGGNGTFGMSENETLTASDLDTWLDELQETLPGKVTVIYDACESGSFLSSLTPPSGKERVVITSTSPAEPAVFMNQGSMSFSNYFWSHIFNGVSVKDALDLVQEAIGISLGGQTSMLDADGNGIGNEAEDYALIENTYIGNGTVISGDAPVIGSVSPAQTITGISSGSLFAESVIDNDGIERVWAVIRPPDYSQGSADNPVTSLPSIELTPVGENRYEGTYNGFHAAGTYQIAIYARDRQLNTCIPKLTTISVGNPLRRRAIIIAGGPESDPLWPAIEKNAGAAYEALTFQGYTNEDIYFMSPVAFSTGHDASPTVSNLQFALDHYKTDTYDLVLYMVGKGGYGIFQMNTGEIVQGAQLNAWLDSLQESIPGKVTVICDACGSGSLLPLLTPFSGKERIVIGSSSNAESAYFLSGGDISFSKFFWSQVANGVNVRNAFVQSKDAIHPSCRNQNPLMDDNGNGIGNEKTDGNLAKNYTIGMGVMLGGDNPIVNAVSPAQTLSGETIAAIRAEQVTTTGTIEKVWAVITPPGYGPGLCETPEAYLPTVVLTQKADGSYEGTYDGFDTSGTYGVAVYAMDQNGNISMPEETTVTQGTGHEIGAPIVSTGSVDSVSTTSARLNAEINPNGANTTWTFEYGTGTDYGSMTEQRTTFGTTTISLSAVITGLTPNTIYHYRITATNSSGTALGEDAVLTTLPVFFVSRDDPLCGGNNPCYTTIQAAVNVAAGGVIIKIAGGTYEETVELNAAKYLTLSGQWNAGFTNQNGEKTVIKAPRAAKGALTLQNVNIKP